MIDDYWDHHHQRYNIACSATKILKTKLIWLYKKLHLNILSKLGTFSILTLTAERILLP